MLKLVNTAEPKWHEYAQGVRVEICPLTRSKMREFLVAADGDEAAYERLVADHVVRNWDGLIGEDDKPLEVSVENKLAVRDNPTLCQWIDIKARGLLAIEEKELKNSERSPASSTPAT